MNLPRGIAVFMLAVFGLALLAACGGDSSEPVATNTPAAAPTATEAAGPPPGEGDAEAGRQVAAQCLACHTADGSTGVGPSWKGLYGSEVTLESGETVTADEDYIRESILEPNAKIHQGFASGLMPEYGSILNDQQITDLIAYIRTLQ